MIISEILALMSNNNCELLITTHSPYILGAVNNLIYANYLFESQNVVSEIEPSCYIKNHNAYFVNNGGIKTFIEATPERLIANEVIDGASEMINEIYDRLFDLSGDDK